MKCKVCGYKLKKHTITFTDFTELDIRYCPQCFHVYLDDKPIIFYNFEVGLGFALRIWFVEVRRGTRRAHSLTECNGNQANRRGRRNTCKASSDRMPSVVLGASARVFTISQNRDVLCLERDKRFEGNVVQ